MKLGVISSGLTLVALTSFLMACGGDSEQTSTSGGGGQTGGGDAGGGQAGGGGSSSSVGGNPDQGGGGNGGVAGGGQDGGGGGTGGHVDLTPPKAGIPDCAAMFIDPDGVCRPALSKCPAGQIPKMDTGCVPVGIAQCAPIFLQADGMCHASMDACAANQFAVPSEGCVPIDGAGCGTDTFGLVVEQAGDQHVDPSYAGGGSVGSRAAPWTTIAAALAHAAAGGRVVLAAGTYPEAIAPQQSVTVLGRCASMVTISGVTATVPPAIVRVTATSGDVTLESLTVSGNGEGVFSTGGTVHLEGVVIDGAKSAGIDLQNGATATLHHALVRATVKDTAQSGGGLESQGSTSTIAQSAFVDLHASGVSAQNNGALTVKDSRFQRVAKGTAIDGGYGVTVQASNVAVTACAIGFVASDTKPSTLSDSFFGVPATQSFGVQLVINATPPVDAALTVDGLVVAGGDSVGITVEGTGAVVSRTLVKDVLTGVAFDVKDSQGDGGKIVLTDSAATNSGIGLSIDTANKASSISGVLFDTNVDGGIASPTTGFWIQNGATVELDRVAVLASPIAGGKLEDVTSVKLSRSIISGTTPGTTGNGAGENGVGLEIVSCDSVALDGVRIENSHAAGIQLSNSPATIANVLVSGVETGTLYDVTPVGDVGDGILADVATSPGVSITDTWITGAPRAGLLFAKAAGSIKTTHVEGGRYGLAIQGMPKPTFGSDDEISGTDQNVLMGAMLPVP